MAARVDILELQPAQLWVLSSRVRTTSDPTDMNSEGTGGGSTLSPGDAPQRRVSLVVEPTRRDEPRRRISQIADGAIDGRRKSILHNPESVYLEPRRRPSTASDNSTERRKSVSPDTVSVMSHVSHPASQHDGENGKPPQADGFASKKHSMADSMPDRMSYLKPEPDKPWWFIFCKRCYQKETTPSWEPPFWRTLCPYPFCPTYRSFASVLSLVLIGLLLWGVVYCVLGETAAPPRGQLFQLAALTIAAHLGGVLFALMTLPRLVGMLCVGILFQNVGFIHIDHEYAHVVSELRKVALVIILIRAGLDLDPTAMRRLFLTVLKLGLVPWTIECCVIAVMSNQLMGLPWIWAFLAGSIIAAVSPAVVVPCLFRLREKGYGVAKGIPTLIIAVSGIDDATSVAIFGIIHSIMFSQDSLIYQIFQGPLSIIGGVGFGAIWGLLAKFVPEKDDPYVVPLRVLMLFGGGLISVFGSEHIGFGGAGPLGCVAAAFVSCLYWSQQGWEVEDNPVATAFEIFWMIFEPILFGLTGAAIKFSELKPEEVSVSLACLATGVVLRIIGTVLVAIRSKLNLKEKIFVAFSWMAKATVQAALGPVALDSLRNTSDGPEKRYGETVKLICILSIILTAPIGAIIITLTGPRLLTKMSHTPPPEGWRRSARPSLRDISIINEEDDVEKDVQE